jgi:hypothetical protein
LRRAHRETNLANHVGKRIKQYQPHPTSSWAASLHEIGCGAGKKSAVQPFGCVMYQTSRTRNRWSGWVTKKK